MNRVFADTYYFIALINPTDHGHTCAVNYSMSERPSLVTTAWIMTELADGLAETSNRGLFHKILLDVERNPNNLLETANDEIFRQGISLYDQRPDKHWSLTDCISFVVMERHRLSDALTADRHFEQAGFVPLLV